MSPGLHTEVDVKSMINSTHPWWSNTSGKETYNGQDAKIGCLLGDAYKDVAWPRAEQLCYVSEVSLGLSLRRVHNLEARKVLIVIAVMNSMHVSVQAINKQIC